MAWAAFIFMCRVYEIPGTDNEFDPRFGEWLRAEQRGKGRRKGKGEERRGGYGKDCTPFEVWIAFWLPVSS